MSELVLRENTAHDLDSGERMVAANFWDREYETADGETKSGFTAQLLFSDGRREFVGVGSAIEVEGEQWRIVAVEPRGPDGWAKLKVEVE